MLNLLALSPSLLAPAIPIGLAGEFVMTRAARSPNFVEIFDFTLHDLS
jgi:hypothetical protein